MKSYAGHYKFNEMALRVEIVFENDQLSADVAGMGKLAMSAGTKSAFLVKQIQAQLEFIEEEGKVDKIKLYQGGDVIDGVRTEPPKELDYETVSIGDPKIDYSKIFAPFSAEWDLIIGDRKVGTASTSLRHALHKGEPVYYGGSVIRYESMGNKPFADVRMFSKKDHQLVWARNAVSQTEEITSDIIGEKVFQTTLDINTGEIKQRNTLQLDQPINGAGFHSLLAMDIQPGMTVQFPVIGLENISWSKMLVVGKEQLKVDGMEQSFEAWKLEYSSGTIHWVIDHAPYLLKWQMPTGMIWELKSFTE